jgi:CO/xanthine dehydrogenase Mo-binding subunit
VEFVGKSVLRADAYSKVTGSLEYAIDGKMPGMLFARLLRSSSVHARIIRIDAAEARQLPGVVSIFTADDLPKPMPTFGPVIADQPLLADGESKYHGEPVAVVLAEDDEAARAALGKIKVEYQDLPAVCTVEDAIRADAPLVHAGGKGHTGQVCATNIYGESEYKWGDVAKAESECRHVFENVYKFPMIHHLPLEPFSVISYPENDGVVIKSPVQHPFILRRVVGACLGLELSKVRVVPTDIGGGFGAKGYAKLEPLASYLALRMRRPVKITLSVDEGFFTARRLSASVRIKTGFDDQGKIMFQDVTADYLMGAYADAAPRIAAKAGFLGCGPYRTPNLRTISRAIYSNTVPSTAARGFGMPQLVFAIESQMQVASRHLGIDPVEIRLRNLTAKGEELVPGDTPVDGNWSEGLLKAAEMIGWGNPKAADVGRGIGIGIKNPIPAAVSNAIVKLHPDNSVTVAVGTTEMGQGARTTFAQIAAEVLGVPFERIKVVMGDTAAVPFDLATAGSRSTVSTGNAVVAACNDLLNQLRDMAHELDLIDGSEEVKVSGGMVRGCRNTVSYPELMQKYLGPTQGEVIGRGSFKGKKAPGHPLGGLTDFWEIIFTAVEVKVNPATGKVRVTKMVNVSDIGKAVNPLQAKSQEEGGSVMGLGHALLEQMIYDSSGRLKNGSPLDYRIPTTMDVPSSMESFLVENQDGPGPFGAKGVGESGAIGVAAAIAAAVADATGIIFRELPITSEKVWNSLKAQNK